jgi:hypothetical protein
MAGLLLLLLLLVIMAMPLLLAIMVLLLRHCLLVRDSLMPTLLRLWVMQATVTFERCLWWTTTSSKMYQQWLMPWCPVKLGDAAMCVG